MSENGFGNTTFKEKPDISMVFLRQLDRTNMAASRDYETSVIQKLNNLPMTWHKWVEEQDDRYVEDKETFEYEAPCGSPIGDIKNPCLKNPSKPVHRYEDGTINWDDPNILSPKMTLEEYIDYTRLDAVIMEASEYAGLTWNQDTETFKIGTIGMKLSNKRTPVFASDLLEDEEEEEEETDDDDEEEEEETEP